MAWRLAGPIRAGASLSDIDWARALLLTEISWGSDLLGAGLDANTRAFDSTAVELLRSVQYKISNEARRRLLLEHAG